MPNSLLHRAAFYITVPFCCSYLIAIDCIVFDCLLKFQNNCSNKQSKNIFVNRLKSVKLTNLCNKMRKVVATNYKFINDS